MTGGNGFIATNFAKLALSRGYRVTSIDNLSYAGSIRNHEVFANNAAYNFVEEDIRNNSIEKVITSSDFDAVLNFAAESHVDRSIHDDTNFISTNIAGTHNLLNICKNMKHNSTLKPNFKFIQISTDEVYGSLNSEEDAFTELSILKPTNPYSASKASADLLCMSYYKTHNFPVLITRCTNNYGPYQHPEKLIPLTIYRLCNNEKIPIYGSGKQIRDWIYVEDHCEALLKLFFNGKKGEKYNIGSGINCSNLFIIKKILNVFKNKKIRIGKKVKIKFVKDRPGHDIRYALNSNKIKNQLKWKPKISFEDGIKLTFDWYNNNKKYFNSLSKKDILNRLGKK